MYHIGVKNFLKSHINDFTPNDFTRFHLIIDKTEIIGVEYIINPKSNATSNI